MTLNIQENLQKLKNLITPDLFPDQVMKMLNPNNTKHALEIREDDDNNKISKKEDKNNILLTQAKNRFIAEKIREQRNLNQIYEITRDDVNQQTINNDLNNTETIDDDWLIYYLKNASQVSNEQMQYLWAKLLAGEIIKPKTFSKRTIDVLLRMNTEEAKLFEKISEYILSFGSNKAILRDTEFYTKFNLQYSDIMNLGECGLINPSGLINMTFNKRAIIIHYGNKVIIGNMPSDKSIKLDVFPLTTSGIELYSIIKPKINDPYIVAIKEYLEKKYTDVFFEFSPTQE